ncbi:MAG: Na/Pi cotransporter family protein [Deltaproteobacteria bacterium]|nr:Na/Pi cotransporter family protein [Deltaproteobacteria bacterium]
MASILMILGGVGVFLYGLRIMSNGLQKVAGDRLRAILNGLTRNRFTGVFAGFLITCAVQSSSATTVMIVSFANAGLLDLVQAIGPVMGANIGTTITGWMVSLLGFKISITKFALPIIGIGFPLSFINSRHAKQWSEVLVGFGLLFLGLKFLKDGVPDLKHNPEQLAWLQEWANLGFWSILLFILVGTVLTIIVQSSSATMTITLAMAAKGWIGYDVAAAMVLGENLGTTITAYLASIGANRNAKRVARSHTLFNVFGVIWMLPVMGGVLALVDGMIPGDPLTDPLATPTHLAAFHTFFNLTNTAVLIWFVPVIQKAVMWLVPFSEDEKDEQEHFTLLQTGLLSTPELALYEVRLGLQKMVAVIRGMFDQVNEVLCHPDQKLGPLVDEIKRKEDRTDRMEEEIVAFCAEIGRAPISQSASEEITRALDMANDLERMGDHCNNLVLLAARRYDKKYAVVEEARKDLDEMIDLVVEAIELAHQALTPEQESLVGEARIIEKKVNDLRDRARKAHATRMQEGEVEVRAGLIFIDMMTNMEKLGDYAFNVTKLAAHTTW